MTKKLMKPPPKNEKNGPKHQKWPKNTKKGLIFQAFGKKIDFLIKSSIYIFVICFGYFFPAAEILVQKWFGGGVSLIPLCRDLLVGQCVGDVKNIATGETSPVISSLTIMTFITRLLSSLDKFHHRITFITK